MEITAAAQWINSTFAAFDESVTLAVHRLYDIAGGFFSPFFEFISFLRRSYRCAVYQSFPEGGHCQA